MADTQQEIKACRDCGEVRYVGGTHLDPPRKTDCDPAKAKRYQTEPVYGGYTRAQLSDAFDLVKNKENWKYPVDATVPGSVDVALIESAVIFYTGSVPSFTGPLPGHRIRVQAAGYYDAIGS